MILGKILFVQFAIAANIINSFAQIKNEMPIKTNRLICDAARIYENEAQ